MECGQNQLREMDMSKFGRDYLVLYSFLKNKQQSTSEREAGLTIVRTIETDPQWQQSVLGWLVWGETHFERQTNELDLVQM